MAYISIDIEDHIHEISDDVIEEEYNERFGATNHSDLTMYQQSIFDLFRDKVRYMDPTVLDNLEAILKEI